MTTPNQPRVQPEVHHRCIAVAGELELCAAEAAPRVAAFAEMVADGDLDAADVMAANIARIVAAHLADNELRRGPP